MDELSELKSQRDALSERIKLIEAGIKKASYDACMKSQLISINDARLSRGQRQISADEFESGCLDNSD